MTEIYFHVKIIYFAVLKVRKQYLLNSVFWGVKKSFNLNWSNAKLKLDLIINIKSFAAYIIHGLFSMIILKLTILYHYKNSFFFKYKNSVTLLINIKI